MDADEYRTTKEDEIEAGGSSSSHVQFSDYLIEKIAREDDLLSLMTEAGARALATYGPDSETLSEAALRVYTAMETAKIKVLSKAHFS